MFQRTGGIQAGLRGCSWPSHPIATLTSTAISWKFCPAASTISRRRKMGQKGSALELYMHCLRCVLFMVGRMFRLDGKRERREALFRKQRHSIQKPPQHPCMYPQTDTDRQADPSQYWTSGKHATTVCNATTCRLTVPCHPERSVQHEVWTVHLHACYKIHPDGR